MTSLITNKGSELDFSALNAQLNLYDENGQIQFEADKKAIESYLRTDVAPKMRAYNSLQEKLKSLVEEGYYEKEVLELYSEEQIEQVFKRAKDANFQFSSFLGAFKFYTSYALKTWDGKMFLEDFADRVAMNALYLAMYPTYDNDGNKVSKANFDLSLKLVDEIISGRFQPATPTFLNAGKKARGELVSCFLLRIEDNMESIARAVSSALQLSKRGGGVALSLTNLREAGAPIKRIENQSSGVVPVMKLLEDSFSYANQLGARQGAGAVYLHAHHPDIMSFLDTKRENADEKIRIKTLALGVIIPDITFHLAKKGEDMCLFSPYDIYMEYGKPFSDISITEMYDELVKNPKIRKKRVNARKFFQTLAEIQFESGYPYLLFEDNVNRANPIHGRISMSNLCSEILQVSSASTYNPDLSYDVVGKDISCNLGSLNIAKTMDSSNFSQTVEMAIRALTTVSNFSNIDVVPSIEKGNDQSHAIGLGQMNLHGYLAREEILYGSEEALDFVNTYFMCIAYEALKASNKIAQERGETFVGFELSKYASGEFFDKYLNNDYSPKSKKVQELFAKSTAVVPTKEDWKKLKEDVQKYGLYNQNLQAVPPTGSISYINHSTSSIHPIPAKVEIRKEGKVGRVYYAPPYMTNDNLEYFKDAYEIGPEAIIDTYATATEHVDQGLSLTLFYPDTVTSRDLNKAYIYAWKKGVKSLYYVRIRQQALEGTEAEQCVSCML